MINAHTEPREVEVTAVEIKAINLPDNMQRAIARRVKAKRKRRAKIVAAEEEYQAADFTSKHPVALQLRTLQT